MARRYHKTTIDSNRHKLEAMIYTAVFLSLATFFGSAHASSYLRNVESRALNTGPRRSEQPTNIEQIGTSIDIQAVDMVGPGT
jgi:hypothetical protein